jgi:uncharacterized delta-60 repeat protein
MPTCMKNVIPICLAFVLLSWMALPLRAAPGDLDLGYNPNASGTVLTLALLPDGRLMTGGNFYQIGGRSTRLVRLLPDGLVDVGFSSSSTAESALVVLPDGKMLVGSPYGGLRRLLPGGGTDSSFNVSVNSQLNCIALQSDGRIILGGSFTTVNGSARAGLARLNLNGSLDTSFNPAVSAGNEVFSILVLPDDRFIVGGNFTSVAGLAAAGLARLSADGVPDPTFTVSTNGTVYCLAAQRDGKVLFGGNFGSVNGNTAFDNLARLNVDGTLETGFVPDPSSTVFSIALQTDGKMVIAGGFTTVGQVLRPGVARLLPDGTTDVFFDTNARYDGYSATNGVLIEAGGAVVVGGSFTSYDQVPRGRICRLENEYASQSLTLDGQSRVLWLRGGSSPEVSTVAFELSTNEGLTWQALGSGVRMAGGWELTGLDLPEQGMVRARGRTAGGYLNSSLGLVETVTGFGAQPELVVEDLAGADIADGGGRDFGLVPVGTTGSRTFYIRNAGEADLTGLTAALDGPDAGRFSISVSPSSPLVANVDGTTVTVDFTPTAPGTRVVWLRLMSNDADEAVFDVRLSGTGTSTPLVTLSSATGITTTGATMQGGVTGNGLATSVRFEWGPATSYATIHAAAPSVVSSFTSQPVSAVLTGLLPGTTYTYRIRAVNALGTTLLESRSFTTTAARVELPGDVVASFPQVVEGTIYCTAVQPDGKMLVGGDINEVNGLSVSTGLIRLNPDGTHDASFNATGVYNVRSLAVLPDGRILVGKTYNMQKLNANGSDDSTFAPGVEGDVHGISVLPDGRIMIVGDFTQVGGTATNNVARLHSTGVKDTSFFANINAATYGLAVQPDGKVLVAGRFTQVNGAAMNWLARLNENGSTDTGFNPAMNNSTSAHYNPRCLILQPDGKILVSGVSFSSGTSTRRLNADGTQDVIFSSSNSQSMCLQVNGDLISASSSTIQRHFASGSSDFTFNNRVGYSYNNYSLGLLESGKILVGGSFSTFDGLPMQSLALLENAPPTESLTVPSAGRVLWLRGGTAPEAQYVTFELSTNQGASWSMLGVGTWVAGGWEMTGASLPASGLLRARARVVSGMNNGSSGLIETLASFGTQPVLVVENHLQEALPSGAVQDFGQVLLGGGASRSFTLKNAGTAPLTGLTLTKGGADAADFTITQSPATTVAVGGSTSFTVLFSPSSSSSSKQAVVHLAADSLLVGQKFDLPLLGNARPVLTVAQSGLPPLPATGAAVNFGSLPAQASVTRLFTLTNNGTQVANTLEAVVLGDADFTVQTLNPMLAVGQSQTFAVTFTPSAMGQRSAVLTLRDAAHALAASVYIALTGNAGGTAISQSVSGSTVGRPSWARPGTGTPPTGLSGRTAPYDVVSFVVPETRAYKVSCQAVSPANWDLMLFLYADGFNAEAPLNNILIGDDDSGVGYNSFFATQLQAGRLYHLVITGYNEGGAGSYTLEVAPSPPELAVEHPSSTRLTSGTTTLDFGTVAVSATAQKSIRLRNLGADYLRGLRVVLEGADTSGFSVSPLYRNTLGFEDSFSFNVNYQPLTAGMISQATLRIFSNDPAVPSFTIGLTGASQTPVYTMALKQDWPQELVLADGASLNFGEVTLGAAVDTRFYTITNTGTGMLTGLAVTVDGAASADYTFAYLPSATLAPGATTNFGLRFNPKATGTRAAALHVRCTQITNPIDVNLSGIGKAPVYAVVVEEPFAVPRASNHEIAFGEVTQDIPVQRRFYIRNIGTGVLKNLAKTKTGANSADFTLSPGGNQTLSPGNWVEMTVTFASSTLGARAAVVQITADDLPPFTLRLSATVVEPAPRIQISQAGVMRGQPGTDVLTDGTSVVSLPHTALGATAVTTLVIENTGTEVLSGLATTLAGSSSSDFNFSAPEKTVLEPGEATSFTVSFTPSETGQRTATLQIMSNDSERSPFDIGLSGTGFTTFPYTGTTQDAPRWQRPHQDGNSVPQSLGSTSIPHEVVCFQVMATQTYEVRSTATQGWDNFLCLYEGSFDASQPLQSLIAANDDDPNVGTAACDLTLEVGKTYYAVTTGYRDSSQGGYQLDVRTALPSISVEQPVGNSLESGVSVLDFGQVALNDTRSLSLTIRNIGGVELNLGTLQIDSPPAGSAVKYFTLQQPAVTVLAPNEVVTVLVSFKPGVEGLFQGQIRISSNDAARPLFTIDLRGNGTRAMPVIGNIGVNPGIWGTDDFPPGFGGLTGLPYKDDFFSVRVAGNYRLGTCFRQYVGRIILCLYEVTVDSKGVVTHKLIKAVDSMTGEVFIENCPLVVGKLYCLRTSGSTGTAPGDYLVTIEPPTGTAPPTTHPVVVGGIRVTVEGSNASLEDDASTLYIGNGAYRPNQAVQAAYRVFTITNTGSFDLIIQRIRVIEGDTTAFHVQLKDGKSWPGTVRIAKGASISFRIGFLARRIGYHSAKIVLDTSLSGSAREFGIYVAGTGLSGNYAVPGFTTLPKPQLIFAGGTARFTASATGADPLTFQWQKGSAAIPNAKFTKLVISKAKPGDAGVFRLKVTNQTKNFGGVIFSSPAYLGVVTRPAAAVSVVGGKDLSLTCTVSSPKEVVISYQWHHRGIALTDDQVRIIGSRTSKLVIKGVRLAEAGAYHCVVTMSPRLGDFTPITLTNSSIQVRVFIKPVLDPITLPALYVGQPIQKWINAVNQATSFTVTGGLPSGVTLNKATGLLSGKPNVVITEEFKDFVLSFTASNPAGPCVEPLRVVWRIKRLPPGTVGTYTGLVDRLPALSPGLGGSFSVAISAGGTLTGKVRLSAKELPFTGILDVPEAGTEVTLPETAIKSGSTTVLWVQFTLQLATGELTGHVRNATSGPCPIQGWRAETSGLAGYAAKYNSGILPPSLVMDDAVHYPQGEGYTTLSLTNKGLATWTGRLADGTAITGAATLGMGGRLSLFTLLNANSGSLHGWSTIDATTGSLDGTLTWHKIKPVVKTSTRSYNDGIPLHSLTHQGGKYLPPTSGLILGITPPSAATTANVWMTLLDGALDADFTQPGSLSAKHVLTAVPPIQNALKPTFKLSTGIVSGTFTILNADPKKNRPGTFSGVVVPRLDRACGHQLLPLLPVSAGETVSKSDIRSGLMMLTTAVPSP